MRLLSRVHLTAVALLLSAPSARAQNWVQDAEGDWAYVMDYRTSGAFVCHPNIIRGTCSASGNSLTLSNESGTLTYSFVGTQGTLMASNAISSLAIGRLDVQFSGPGPFVFPAGANAGGFNPWFPIAWFGLSIGSLNSSLPGNVWGMDLYPYSCNIPLCISAEDRLVLGDVGTPPPGTPRVMVVHRLTPLDFTPVSSSQQLSASVSLVPEPSTYVLLGTGLLTLGGMAARRRAPVS